MATAVQYVPVDVYPRSAFEPDAEYVDGEIQERAAGELDHAAWQAAIQNWFWKHEQEWGIRVLAGLRVQVSPTRYRVPDVVVLENTGPLREMEQIVKTAPVAVFEILSPEDKLVPVLEKLADYEAVGVRGIFVVNPRSGSKPGEKYQYVGGDLKHVEQAGLMAGQTGRMFRMSEIEGLVG